jgi:hypothetical protein
MITLLALSVLMSPIQDPKPRIEPLIPAPKPEAVEVVEPGLAQDDRRELPTEDAPFEKDRPLLRISAQTSIAAAELNTLVQYYRSYRGGSDALLLRNAVDALLPSKVMEDVYREELPGMRKRMDEALAALKSDRSWESVVAEFSDDSEAPTPDARYTFERGVAVQPFDRFAHTAATGTIAGPFLTKYGYHVLQVLGYERNDEKPSADQTTVRHILVMYPTLRKMDREGGDIRAHIKEQIAAAKLTVLEAGHANLLPPSHRPKPAPETPSGD